MHEGIGRAGYRLLAAVFLGLGLLGAGLAWYGTTQPGTAITLIGLLVGGTSLVLLFVQAVLLPGGPAAPRLRPEAESSPETPEPRRESAPPAPPATPAARPTAPTAADEPVVHFDYKHPQPAARAAPEQLVMPDAFQDMRPPAPHGDLPRGHARPAPAPGSGHDAAAWPGSRGPSTWTTEQRARQEAARRAGERRPRDELTHRYTQRTPTVRQILTDPPATRKAATTAPLPEGKSRGKCGRCGTVLLAPNRRPLKLKCPVCQKVSRLE